MRKGRRLCRFFTFSAGTETKTTTAPAGVCLGKWREHNASRDRETKTMEFDFRLVEQQQENSLEIFTEGTCGSLKRTP